MSDLDDIIEDLKTKRDELRVQVHLASKEAQEEWQELEEKFDSFVQRAQLKETGEGVGDALSQLGRELKAGFDRMRQAVKD
jgi:hypothetical protein